MTSKFPSAGSSRQYAIDLTDDDGFNERTAFGQSPARSLAEPPNDNKQTKYYSNLDTMRDVRMEETTSFVEPLPQAVTLPHGHSFVDSTVSIFDVTVKPQMRYQLADGTFFAVKYLSQDMERNVSMTGWQLVKNFQVLRAISKDTNNSLYSYLPRTQNDLCMLMKTSSGTIEDPLSDDGLITLPANAVEKQREIYFTNFTPQEFGYLSGGISVAEHGIERVEEEGALCCRWKYVETVSPGDKRVVGQDWLMLRQDECDVGLGKASVLLRKEYGRPRQTTQSSRSKVSSFKTPLLPKSTSTVESGLMSLKNESAFKARRKRTIDEVEKIEGADRKLTLKRRTISTTEVSYMSTAQHGGFGGRTHLPTPTGLPMNEYALGDLCCGSGAVLRAGAMTGLRPHLALDCEEVAIETVHQNFPEIPQERLLHMNIEDFAQYDQPDPAYRVDILHISYPCQGHSRLNRGQNPERDAIHNVLGSSLGNILKRIRPRIVTLEQTSHITTKNEGIFDRIVKQELTAAGYGVRSKVFKMRDYGVPQVRPRLILIGICPGERVPNWPAPTHGTGPGLKAPVTVGQAIQRIPNNTTLHDIAERKREFGAKALNLPVLDLNQPLPSLVTTSGVRAVLREADGDYRPTYRQQMRFQTFPDVHVLTGKTQKDFTTLIGNAVPCAFMQWVFQGIIKSLRQSDREESEWTPDIIEID